MLVAIAVLDGLGTHLTKCPGCNLILISVDTLRAQNLGCYGYERQTSPAIDELARVGVLFENAYSASAWTLPGHIAMLTGRYPTREGEFVFMSKTAFPDSYVPLAQVLKDAGYVTAGLMGGGFVATDLGFGRGFDTYALGSPILRERPRSVGEWLDRRDPRHPFFLFLHGYDVHEPYLPAPEDRLRFIDEVPPECRGVPLRCNEQDEACRRSPRGREYVVSQYDGAILGVDRFVAWLVAELKRRGLYERTIIALTGDHGEALMENGIGCGHLGSLEESVFRVPLILRVPKVEPDRVAARVSGVDLAPTLLALVGLPPAPSMHGRSLLPLVEGREEERQINGLTGNDPGNVVLASIVDDKKIVKWRYNRGAPWTYELYDLATDPAARQNRLPEVGPPPPLFYEMLERMAAWERHIDLRIDGEQTTSPTLSQSVRDQLEHLGYR